MIYSAVKKFSWYYDCSQVDWARNLIDSFDFDGDGRLNPREFILMIIINNKNILGSHCLYCFNDIITNKIDPIFYYLDCNQDGLISSEDMWNHLNFLRRGRIRRYNIYKCYVNKKNPIEQLLQMISY